MLTAPPSVALTLLNEMFGEPSSSTMVKLAEALAAVTLVKLLMVTLNASLFSSNSSCKTVKLCETVVEPAGMDKVVFAGW